MFHRPLLSMVLCVAFAALPAAARAAEPAAPAAQEKTATVRFSYEKWSRSGQKRYVLVPVPSEVPPGAMPERVREVFRELVAAKRNSYGDARLAFQPDAEKTGEVFVYLDAAKADYHAIVMAETVYSFTENGAARVRFPKVADAGWTRDDVPFPAYVLTLPLWQGLPPADYTASLLVMPDGGVLPQRTAIERLKAGDRVLVEALWSHVSKGPPPAALAAVQGAIALGLPDLQARLLPVLGSADPALRGAALAGLAGHDKADVNQAIRKVMDEDREPKLRDQAAGILSKSKDPAYSTAAQYHALRSADPAIVAAAAEGLGDSKQAEAGQRLLEVVGHADARVRAAAIASLQKRAEHAALAKALDDAKLAAPVRLEIAQALSRGADAASKQAGLAHLAVNGAGDASAQAAAALGGIDQPLAYDALGQAVKHAEGGTRIAAAGALAKLGQPRALPLLSAAKVDDPESGAAMLAAIRSIYAAQKPDFVLEATKQSDAVLRRSAVATLGEIVKREGKKSQKKMVEVLQTLASDKEPQIRAAAALSFEAIGGDEVRGEVLKLATDEAIEVKRASARALRAFPGNESVKLLLEYTRQKDAELLANAIDSLGVLEEMEGRDAVLSGLNHDDVRVRRAATASLVSIGRKLPEDKRSPLLSYFSERLFDKDADVRLSALRGLNLVKDPRVVTAMSALLQDPVAEVRKATLLAMAETGNADAVEALASGLEDSDPAVRRTALDAFRKLKKKESVKLLSEYVKKEQDKGLAEEASKVIQVINGG